MRSVLFVLLAIFLLPRIAGGAPKPHVLSFGRWATVKWFVGAGQDKPLDLKVRALYLDSRLKEFTLGTPHDVTDRLIVVRRAFRLNDALPEETSSVPNWRWRRGGWRLVGRMSGHVSAISLADVEHVYGLSGWCSSYVGVF